MISYHKPVFLEEAVSSLNLRSEGIYVDATMGGGGHSLKILQNVKGIKLYAFDRDADAIANASTSPLKEFKNLVIIKDDFANLWSRLSLERIRNIDGIIFDLGVSSHQFDDPSRGFSFTYDGKLDMRMDQDLKQTAADVVNNSDYNKLKTIFLEYGEEGGASRIASAILKKRETGRIETTLELAEIIDRSIFTKKKIKAKARIFQALRIYINKELESLETALADCTRIMNPGGHIVVISYHSLEDRIVKHFFLEQEKDCICPPEFPKCICNKKSTLKIITRKPLTPSDEEIRKNPRARSAKMRVAEKKEVLCSTNSH